MSPETGLVTLFANIAVGDWCIAVEDDAGEGLRPATPPRFSLPIFHAQFARILSAHAEGGAQEASCLKRIEFL